MSDVETNKGEPLKRCRKHKDAIKTGRALLARDKHGGYLTQDESIKHPIRGSFNLAYCPCGGRYEGGVNTSQASIGNLGTCMLMQREKSKWKNREDQNTDAACRGGTTRSSDESSQLRGSEGVVLSSSAHGSTEREESMNRAKLYWLG